MQNRIFFIADDDPDDRELIIKALHEIDASAICVTALNGEDAIGKLEEEMILLPDLIFLDLNMPKIDGKKCLALIKANARISSIPVVIYSTSTEDSEVEIMKHMGAAFFLKKPNSFQELCQTLRDVLLQTFLL